MLSNLWQGGQNGGAASAAALAGAGGNQGKLLISFFSFTAPIFQREFFFCTLFKYSKSVI